VELGLLDVDDMPADASACGMPVSRQIARLEHALAERSACGISVVSVDLLGLEECERHAALDAIVADEPSPYVILGGRLVCAGSVDVAAVLAALVD